jgi:hypothetical protein
MKKNGGRKSREAVSLMFRASSKGYLLLRSLSAAGDDKFSDYVANRANMAPAAARNFASIEFTFSPY